MRNDHGLANVKCKAWSSIVYSVEQSLGEHRTGWFNDMRMLFFGKEEIADQCKHSHRRGMTHCRHQLALWKDIVEKETKKIPPFSYFISSVETG